MRLSSLKNGLVVAQVALNVRNPLIKSHNSQKNDDIINEKAQYLMVGFLLDDE